MPSVSLIFAVFYGDFDRKTLEETFSKGFSTILFWFLIYIIVVVSLNALIAFSGDIFERILADKKAVLTRIKAECIIDLYCIMLSKKREEIEANYKWTYRLVPIADIHNSVENEYKSGDDNDMMNRRATRKHFQALAEKSEKMKVEMNSMKAEINSMKVEVQELKVGINQILELLREKR